MAAEYRYDAFISYRHISPDKPIAERLQKLLESYVPPKDLRSGFRKMHLFRDETELPTSNDLGGDIKSALEQSRFLIVICSPALEKSKWCMQEIDYFRSLHGNTNRQILTLLVNDPDQPPVFPEPLRYEPRLIKTEDGAEKEGGHEQRGGKHPRHALRLELQIDEQSRESFTHDLEGLREMPDISVKGKRREDAVL